MNDAIKKKINGLGRAGQIITTILLVFVSFTCATMLLAETRFLLQLFRNLLKLDFAAVSQQVSSDGADILNTFLTSLSGIGSLITFISLRKLSGKIRVCETPFSDAVMHDLSVYAWIRLVCMTVTSGLYVVRCLLDIEPFYTDGLVLYVIRLAISVLFSVIVLLLTKIFRHGAQLQKEIDETL